MGSSERYYCWQSRIGHVSRGGENIHVVRCLDAFLILCSLQFGVWRVIQCFLLGTSFQKVAPPTNYIFQMFIHRNV